MIMDIHTIRQGIDSVDDELRLLFLERLGLAEKIASEKAGLGLAICQPEREAALKERLLAEVDEKYLPYYSTFIDAVLDISKAYQRDIIENMEGQHDEL